MAREAHLKPYETWSELAVAQKSGTKSGSKKWQMKPKTKTRVAPTL